LWCFHGTVVSFGDVMRVLSRPVVAGLAATVASVATVYLAGPLASPLARLLIGGSSFGIVYLTGLLVVLGQKTLYVDLLRAARA
jgi:hypothetical protein